LTELFLNNIYLALLLPLWIFLIIMVGRFFSVYVNKVIIYTNLNIKPNVSPVDLVKPKKSNRVKKGHRKPYNKVEINRWITINKNQIRKLSL